MATSIAVEIVNGEKECGRLNEVVFSHCVSFPFTCFKMDLRYHFLWSVP